MNTSILEGEKVRLRAYTRDDLEKARLYINDLEVGLNLRPPIPFPFRPEDEIKWYESLNPLSEKEYSFAIELKADSTYLGGCGVFNIQAKNRHCTVGIFLGKDFLGKGFGTEALQLLVDFCFLEINVNKVKLDVFSFNRRAIRSYEKIGFKLEGTLREEIYRNGRYYDNLAMGILRSEWEARRNP